MMDHEKHIKWGCILIGIALAISQGDEVRGQDTLESKQIKVVKEFEPITREAVKIHFQPELPGSQKKFEPQVEYETPSRPIRFGYKTTAIRALSMRKEEPLAAKRAYLKGGFGNYSSPLLEAYFNSGRSEKFQYGAFAKHLSSNGPLENQKFSSNQIRLFGKTFFEGHTLSANLDYHRRVSHLYGYIDSLSNYNEDDADSLKQRFSTWSGQVNFFNHEKNETNFDYRGHFDFYHLSDLYGATEQQYDIGLYGAKRLENGDDIVVDLNIKPTIFKTDSSRVVPEGAYTADSTLSRTFISLNPKFIFRKPEWKMKLQLGGRITFINDEPEFMPDIYLERIIFDEHLIYYSGWEGKVIENSYRQLTNRNPYLTPRIRMQYGRILNSYTGVKGRFANDFFYELEFAYKTISDMPLFVNDSLDRKKFHVVYDERATILNFHGELGYQRYEKAKVALKADYNSFDMADFEEPWHVPQFKLSLAGHYNIQNKIRLQADIFALDRIYARVDGDPKKLPFIFNANVRAQYQYLDNLSFFLNFENVIGQYTRWYGYPSLGFHIIGGAALTF